RMGRAASSASTRSTVAVAALGCAVIFVSPPGEISALHTQFCTCSLAKRRRPPYTKRRKLPLTRVPAERSESNAFFCHSRARRLVRRGTRLQPVRAFEVPVQ